MKHIQHTIQITPKTVKECVDYITSPKPKPKANTHNDGVVLDTDRNSSS